MIRRPTTHLHLHNNNSARPDPVTSISSNSVSKETTLCERHAIKKSDTFDSLNNRFESLDYNDHTNTCTTSRHLRLHDGRRHRSHFDEANSSEIHKNLGGFHEKRNEVEMGRTSGRKSLPYHTSANVERPSRTERNDYDMMDDVRCGGGRGPSNGNISDIFSMDNMSDLGLIVSGDGGDHMLFDLDELEENLDVVVNQKPERPDGPSSYVNHLGMSSNPSDSLSSRLKNHTFSDPATSLRGCGCSNSTTCEPDLTVSASVTINNQWIDKNEMAVTQSTFPSLASNNANSKHRPSSTRHKHWTKEEDDTLRNAVALEGRGRTVWKEISRKYFNKIRSGTQCKNRFKNHLQPGLVRGSWKPDEDRVVQRMVLEGFPWRDIAHQLPGRVGDSIRERYVNFLDPRLKKTPWTKEEDDILFQYQRIVGNKWSEIRKCIPGRSENSIKNRYHNRKNSHFRRIKRAEKAKSKNIPMQISAEPNKEAAVDAVNLVARPDALDMDFLPDDDEVIAI